MLDVPPSSPTSYMKRALLLGCNTQLLCKCSDDASYAGDLLAWFFTTSDPCLAHSHFTCRLPSLKSSHVCLISSVLIIESILFCRTRRRLVSGAHVQQLKSKKRHCCRDGFVSESIQYGDVRDLVPYSCMHVYLAMLETKVRRCHSSIFSHYRRSLLVYISNIS